MGTHFIDGIIYTLFLFYMGLSHAVVPKIPTNLVVSETHLQINIIIFRVIWAPLIFGQTLENHRRKSGILFG